MKPHGDGLKNPNLFEFLSDKYAFQKWLDECEDDGNILDHVKRATLFAIDNELSDIQREYIIKYLLEHKTIPEIAGIYGVNKSTVSRTITRARQRLMRVLRYSTPWLLNAEMIRRNKRT